MHDKTYNKTCVTSKDSDQSVHIHSKAWVLVYPSLDRPDVIEGTYDQRRLWSDCADAQADLNLRWSHKSYSWLVLLCAGSNDKCKLLFHQVVILLRKVYFHTRT